MMKKILKIICFTLIFIVILFFAYKYKSERLLVKINGYSSLIVGSGSMYPELTMGDIIIIKELPDYEVGDIITYNVNNDYLVTHRIIEKEGTNFVTKGDYNNTYDKEYVSIDNIEGKIIYKSKLLKYINKYKIIIIILAVFLFILFI